MVRLEGELRKQAFFRIPFPITIPSSTSFYGVAYNVVNTLVDTASAFLPLTSRNGRVFFSVHLLRRLTLSKRPDFRLITVSCLCITDASVYIPITKSSKYRLGYLQSLVNKGLPSIFLTTLSTKSLLIPTKLVLLTECPLYSTLVGWYDKQAVLNIFSISWASLPLDI